MDPALQADGTSVESSRRRWCTKEDRDRQLSELVVNIEGGAKLSETIGTGGRLEYFSRWMDHDGRRRER